MNQITYRHEPIIMLMMMMIVECCYTLRIHACVYYYMCVEDEYMFLLMKKNEDEKIKSLDHRLNNCEEMGWSRIVGWLDGWDKDIEKIDK